MPMVAAAEIVINIGIQAASSFLSVSKQFTKFLKMEENK